MMADPNAKDATADDVDIASAAQKLKDSFDEMSSLTDELSGTMGEVADGFASFSESTSGLHENESARVEPSAGRQSGHAVADD
jgi:uncharacterized phage infection (PIP) family protein YhgE